LGVFENPIHYLQEISMLFSVKDGIDKIFFIAPVARPALVSSIIAGKWMPVFFN
jgi:hypothetical protein